MDGKLNDIENLIDSIRVENASWSFDGEVSEYFDAHVEKSVPLYHQGHDLICQVSDFFLNDGSLCYEIGCSTAMLLKKMNRHCQGKEIRFVGIDKEPKMTAKASELLKGEGNIRIITEDIMNVEFEPADLIVSYYTMQFIKPKDRQELFNRIYKALNWGGGFLLFEKVRAPDARFQDMMTNLYIDYKLDQGYNEKEIVSKSRSLKGVLEPFSSQANMDMLNRAGFEDRMSIMKFICFEGFLAIK